MLAFPCASESATVFRSGIVDEAFVVTRWCFFARNPGYLKGFRSRNNFTVLKPFVGMGNFYGW